MELQKIKQNKTASILAFGVPATVGMLMSSLITIVDGYFAGNYVGSKALVAINLGLPLLYFYLAVGLMIGVGGSVIAGIAIGNGDRQKSCSVFSQSMVLVLLAGVTISVVAGIFFNPLMKFLKAGEVADLFRLYYSVFLFSAPLMIIDSCYGMFLRSDGEPQIYMGFNALAIILNGILDYIFTAKLGLGIRGLIFASLISLSLSVMMCTMYFILRKNKNENHILLRFTKFSFNRETVCQTFCNGSSECIGELAGCISMFCYNFVLLKYIGPKGVAAFTIIGYSIFVFNMITIGLGEGMCPLVSFSLGAKESELCVELRKITNRIVFVVGMIFAVALFLGGKFYCSFFVKEAEIIGMVSRGFRLFSAVFLLQGFNVIGSMYFTSMSMPKQSALIASLRGIVILLTLIFVFSALFGMDGIWLTAPVTEALTLVATILFCVKGKKYE